MGRSGPATAHPTVRLQGELEEPSQVGAGRGLQPIRLGERLLQLPPGPAAPSRSSTRVIARACDPRDPGLTLVGSGPQTLRPGEVLEEEPHLVPVHPYGCVRARTGVVLAEMKCAPHTHLVHPLLACACSTLAEPKNRTADHAAQRGMMVRSDCLALDGPMASSLAGLR